MKSSAVELQSQPQVVESHPLACGEDGTHFTFCRICEAYCGLTAEVRNGRIVKLAPDRDNPHSRGHVCVKGTNFLDVTYDPDRVTQPLRRDRATGEFRPVSWDEALDDIARRLADILRSDGVDAVATYGGNPAVFNTKGLLAFGRFCRALGIWKKFSAASLDVMPRMVANHIIYGATSRLPIPDLPRCDFLILLGANPMVSNASLVTAPRIRHDLDAIAARGKVLVIDPRLSETAKRYEHLSVLPDSDAWLLAAMLRQIFIEQLVSGPELEKRVQGLDKLSAAVMPVTPELAATHCGVPAERIVALAREFASTPRAVIYGRTGTCRGRFSTLVNVFICALNIVTGKFASEGGWIFSDGAIDPVVRGKKDFEIRNTRFGPLPYVMQALPMSIFADEMLEPGEGRVRALFMQAGNTVVSAPGGARTAEAIKALELFVAVDIYVNETNKHADYILPGTTFLEREDLPMLGLSQMVRPFVQYSGAVIPPVGKVRDDDVILAALAERLHGLLSADAGKSGYKSDHAPAFPPLQAIDGLFARSGKMVRDAEGVEHVLSIERLKQYPHGVELAENKDFAASWSKSMHTDGQLVLWHPMLDAELARMRVAKPPTINELRLFTMRDIRSINSWMHNSDRLVRSQAPCLLLNPVDAANRNIKDGQKVKIASAVAALEVPVRVTDDVARGGVCYPHGWGHRGGWQRANATDGVNINLLYDHHDIEPVSGSSLLDGLPVTVSPV